MTAERTKDLWQYLRDCVANLPTVTIEGHGVREGGVFIRRSEVNAAITQAETRDTRPPLSSSPVARAEVTEEVIAREWDLARGTAFREWEQMSGNQRATVRYFVEAICAVAGEATHNYGAEYRAWRKRAEEAESKLADLGERPYTLEEMAARVVAAESEGRTNSAPMPCRECGARTAQPHAIACAASLSSPDAAAVREAERAAADKAMDALFAALGGIRRLPIPASWPGTDAIRDELFPSLSASPAAPRSVRTCDQCRQPMGDDARDKDHENRHTIRGCIRALASTLAGRDK